MSLDLDDRQRAMLREMGVHVWQPQKPTGLGEAVSIDTKNRARNDHPTSAASKNGLTNASPAPTPASPPPPNTHAEVSGVEPVADQVVAPVVSVAPASSDTRRSPAAGKRSPSLATPSASPTVVTGLPAGIASLDWPALNDAVAHCQACAMCLGRRAPVLAAPIALTPCDWLVAGDPPDEAQERAGLPFVDDAGKLLDNMLRAVGVRRFVPDAEPPDPPTAFPLAPAKRAYLTHVLKCRPALMRAPEATELATCANYLRREIALTQPKVILAMGRFAMQLLLSETPPESAKLPLGKLRGQVWRFAGVPVVVTYPPSYLLRSGQDKGKAWADLCLAMDVAQGHLPI